MVMNINIMTNKSETPKRLAERNLSVVHRSVNEKSYWHLNSKLPKHKGAGGNLSIDKTMCHHIEAVKRSSKSSHLSSGQRGM